MLRDRTRPLDPLHVAARVLVRHRQIAQAIRY
jgi:hypothetical protein